MGKLFSIGLVSAVAVTSSFGALTAPTIDTSDFEAIAGAVLLAGAVFWGIRKAIGLVN